MKEKKKPYKAYAVELPGGTATIGSTNSRRLAADMLRESSGVRCFAADLGDGEEYFILIPKEFKELTLSELG